MKRPEDGLQRAVLDCVYAAHVPGLFWFHCPNGGVRSKIEAAIMKGLGVRGGVPDLIFCIPPGRFAGLELKAPGGRRSEAQRQVEGEILYAGGLYAVTADLGEAIDILIGWGALKKDRIMMPNVTHRVLPRKLA